MLQLWLGFTFSLLAWFFQWYWKTFHSDLANKINKIPGPRGHPIFGIALSTPRETEELHDFIHRKLPEQYGPIFKCWVFSRARVLISSPTLFEKILNSKKHVEKGESYNVLLPRLGTGLLLASGERWHKHRRLLTPAFHFQILDNFISVFNKDANILCEIMHNNIGNNKSIEIDVWPYLKRCTFDIICETAMGTSFNSQLGESSEYIQACHKLGKILIRKNFSIWKILPSWMYETFSSEGRDYHKSLKITQKYTIDVIRKRKTEIEEEPGTDGADEYSGQKKRRPFLDLLLIEAKRGSLDFSETDIRYEVETFMSAGHDTTAAAMTWFLYCMGTNESKQKLVERELQEVFEDNERPCTADDITRLKYLECCIKEALRLYPPAFAIERTIGEEIELDGYQLEAGTTVALQIYSLHRNEKYFPDALAFKPERFLSNTEDGSSEFRNPFTFVPFSAGPRNCIGQRFALLEMKVILSTLLRRFKFRYDMKKYGPALPCNELVLKPKRGMPLDVSPRD